MQHTAKDMDLILLLSFVVVFLVSYIFLSRPKGLPQGSIVFFFIYFFIYTIFQEGNAFSCYSYSTLWPSVQTYLHIYKH